jgi:hypothetical protein
MGPDLGLGAEPHKPTESGKLAPELDGEGVHAGCNVMPDSSIGIVADFEISGCHKPVRKQPIVLRFCILRHPSGTLHVRTWLVLTYCNTAIDVAPFPTE